MDRLRRRSSSAPAPAAARSPGTWPPPARASCCSSAATGCSASRENWDAAAVFVDNRYVSPDTWYDEQGKAFQPQVHYFVGGATKLYGAALYRLRPEDFGELRHHDGISPAWPITYDELEPYYLRPSRRTRCTATAAKTRPRRRPAPRTRSRPSRTSRASSSSRTRSPRPATTRSTRRAASGSTRPNLAFSACVRCANCDGFPCLVHAKSDADVLGVRPALEYPNVTLLTNAQVVKLETDAAGTAVTEVVVERDGAEERYAGDIVVLACGAANTAKLLLLSANDRHPNGLANGSDQVGRNYMFHASQAVLALSREENPTVYQKTLGLNDFYFGERRRRVPAREHPDGRQVAGADVPGREAAGDEARARLVARARRQARDRLLALDRGPAAAREPRHGRPRRQGHARLHGDERRAEEASCTRSSSRCSAMLGMHPDHLVHRFAYMKNDIPVAGCAHQAGTVRFGDRPGDLGPRTRLPRARAGQPLRRRHEHLPEHRRGEPGADGDGELDPRRRPPARADELTPRAATLSAGGRRRARPGEPRALRPPGCGGSRRGRPRGRASTSSSRRATRPAR